MNENLFVGLLRALGPEIFSFVGFTLFVIIAVVVINRLFVDGADASRRTTRKVGFWIWVAVLAFTLWHALSVTVSLRIPRSDVNATEVYRQMDSNVQR